MDVKIKKLHPDAKIPKYAHVGEDAGLDLIATTYEYVNGRHWYGTGLAVEIPSGYFGMIIPRSSINKYDLRLSNSVGILDSGYRDEIKFVFENDSMLRRKLIDEPFWDEFQSYCIHNIYKVGDRVGQLIILPYPQINFIESNELTNSTRNNGGFGSSGS